MEQKLLKSFSNKILIHKYVVKMKKCIKLNKLNVLIIIINTCINNINKPNVLNEKYIKFRHEAIHKYVVSK